MGSFSTRLLVQSGSCTVAPFPIIIGGNIAATNLNQIDYHSPTDRIVGVGAIYDTGVSINIVGSFIPYIVVYQGPLMTFLWGKSLALSGDSYAGVAFSEDGTYIVAITLTTPTISIFKSIDGTLIDQ